MRRWLLGRALGAGALVALAVGGPMVLASLLLASLGGGVEGALARASLVVPSVAMGIASGAVFGLGGVVVGALLPSRAFALGSIVALASLGVLVQLAVPGLAGLAAHQVASPFLALEDLQGFLFAEPGSASRGVAATVAVAVLPLLGLRAAEAAIEERA